MKKQHQHKMSKVGMTMTCSCGFHYDIKCAHIWRIEKINQIEMVIKDKRFQQEQRLYFCRDCGAVQNTNTTTGQTTITQ